MKKQNIAIIAVVAFVLAVAVGYALFRETITINGTATAKGNFDIEVIDAKITGGEGYLESATSAAIGDKANSADLAAELQYPGAYVTYEVTVKNAGSIDALLKNINEENATADQPVVVTYPNLDSLKESLVSGDTDVVQVKVQWNPADDLDEEANGTVDNSVNVETGYTISFDYEQITVQ